MNTEIVIVSAVLITILFIIVLGVYKVIIRSIKKQVVPANGIQVLKTSSESDLEDNRQDPRLSIVWPVLMETSRGVIKAKIKDLSLGGAFIACQDPLPLQTRFNLTIHMPDQKPLTLVCEVIWSNSNVPDDKIVTRGMGIKFVQNAEEDRKSYNNAIIAHLEEHKEHSVRDGHYNHPCLQMDSFQPGNPLPNQRRNMSGTT